MLAVIVLISLIILNIYCFCRKQYLPLYMVCMLFLPNYYGISITDSLPIISPIRIMWVLLIVYSVKNRRGNIRDFLKEDKRCIWLLGYFILRMIANGYYMFTYIQSVKTFFDLMLHSLMFVICIVLLSPSKAEIDKTIEVIVITATCFFALGIFESLTNFRMFDYLYIANRTMLNDHYYRMGVLRATTSLGLPGFYGNMCLIMMPLILYSYNMSLKKRYLFSYALCWLAILFAGSRADMIFACAVTILYTIASLLLGIVKRIIHNGIGIIAGLTLFIIISGSCNDVLGYYYSGTMKSILNEIGFEYDLDEGAPDSIEGYGDNKDGTYSRVRQLSGISYALQVNPLFGLGSGAQARREIKYLKNGEYRSSGTYDMGFVQVICDEGIIGFLGFLLLFIYLCITTKDIFFADTKTGMLLALLIISYLLAMLSTVNMNEFLLMICGITIMAKKELNRIKNKETGEQYVEE